jgi:hypothetical protein
MARLAQAAGARPSPIHGPNQWPTAVPEFDAALRRYISEMTLLGSHLMRGIALALGLQVGRALLLALPARLLAAPSLAAGAGGAAGAWPEHPRASLARWSGRRPPPCRPRPRCPAQPGHFAAPEVAGPEQAYWCTRVIHYPPLSQGSQHSGGIKGEAAAAVKGAEVDRSVGGGPRCALQLPCRRRGRCARCARCAASRRPLRGGGA